MLPAALRACAAGLYPDEASVELLINHGEFLHRRDFGAFVRTGTSITDGTTEMAQVDWDAAITALHTGQLAHPGHRKALPRARRRLLHPPPGPGRETRRLIARLQALGHTVTLNPAA